jgi:hypothetical protein
MPDKGSQNLYAHQSPLQLSLNSRQQELQPVEVRLSHTIPPVKMWDWAATLEHGERCVGVVPQYEPCSPPPDQRVGHGYKKIGIDFGSGSDIDIHTAQHRRFHVRALP